MNLLQL